METSCSQSTLEMLPDEILLETCKYLLCTDILLSFTGLNNRITQMITEYRHHISLHKTSILTSDYLCINILPQIGFQIRSLLIDCCYSILQDNLFIKYFGKTMSIIFPKLEKISLVSYQYNQLIAFLDALHDLYYLVEIRLYSLFPIEKTNQITVARSLIQANNHRITTIYIDDQSSSLHFHHDDCYFNVLRLRIKLRTMVDLSSLFHAVPNVQYLDVILDDSEGLWEYFDELTLSPLFYLTHFQLISTKQLWMLEKLCVVFAQLPIVRHLSLFLSTDDRRLIEGDTILSVLPSTVQQLDYGIYFYHHISFDEIDEIITSWPTSHPVTCFYKDTFLFMHTLPWRLARISFPTFIKKIMSCQTNTMTGYDSSVEQLDVTIDKSFTLTKSLGMISQCRQVREMTFYVRNTDDAVTAEQCPIPHVPKLSRLIQIAFHGPISSDLNHFSVLLNAASNVFRLDLPFDYLWQFIENQQIRHLLGPRITSLSILENLTKPSSVTLNEEHIPIIASTFFRLRDLYVNLAHLSPSTKKISNDNISNESTVQSALVQFDEQKHEVVLSCSSESMVACLLTEFKEHKLVGLCITGQFFEKLNTDANLWLKHNTVLCEQQFEAIFNKVLHRLLIWM
ncbi:unnamed protein product [Rotaria sp. Silwood1]|nr:unnamed protein product [Rotaria sp. Silwood1]CAF3448745.1 unnamed protein product [Rotaria sp. Silwood1]CAF3477385.1 unnamed protein product [Rotaria sp. Silwood1]CAF4708403.1 unnamed protein product [Rotaria sp. Silwood1]CAF4971162.1 unnamed protein product [Rotaria sp. Silwood1]